MPKHTPGPWETLGTIVQAPGIFGADLHVASAPDRPVTADEIEANARLIAAAPDLLAALKELVADEWSYYSDKALEAQLAKGNEMVRPYIAARKAIARAEGKA